MVDHDGLPRFSPVRIELRCPRHGKPIEYCSVCSFGPPEWHDDPYELRHAAYREMMDRTNQAIAKIKSILSNGLPADRGRSAVESVMNLQLEDRLLFSLIEAGCDVDIPHTGSGWTPFLVVAQKGNMTCLRRILDSATLSKLDVHLAMLLAVARCHMECFKLLSESLSSNATSQRAVGFELTREA